MLHAPQGAAKSVGSLVSNRTSAARLYSLLTAALGGAGAAYLLAPQSSLAVCPLRVSRGAGFKLPKTLTSHFLRQQALIGGVDQRAGPGMPGLQGWVLGCLDVGVLRRLLEQGQRSAAPLHCVAEEIKLCPCISWSLAGPGQAR